MKENKGGRVPIIGEWHLIDRVPRWLNDDWDYDPRLLCPLHLLTNQVSGWLAQVWETKVKKDFAHPYVVFCTLPSYTVYPIVCQPLRNNYGGWGTRLSAWLEQQGEKRHYIYDFHSRD